MSSPGGPSSLYVGTGALPVALRGSLATASALEQIDDLVLGHSAASTSASREVIDEHDVSDDLTAFVRRSTLDAYATADRLAALGRDDSRARYPSTALANRLGTIARLLQGGLRARVFYTVQGSYRRIYATVLERWLGLSSKNALNGTLEPLQLLRTLEG